MVLTEQRKQGGPLQCWVAFKLCDDPGPMFLKRIGAGCPGMGTLEMRRKLARLFILAGSAFAHPCAGSREPLSGPVTPLLHPYLNLATLFHITLTSLRC